MPGRERWRRVVRDSRWSDNSASGVERAFVSVLIAGRLANFGQLAIALAGTARRSGHPALDIGLAVTFVGFASISTASSIRARRIVERWLTVEAVIGIGLTITLPFAVHGGELTAWDGWAYPVGLVTIGLVGLLHRRRLLAVLVSCSLGSYLTWLFWVPAVDRITVLADAPAYLGFGVIAYVVARRLSMLAVLADTRAAQIRELERRQTREALHTPFRLLNDFSAALRSGRGAEPSEQLRKARLAETVAVLGQLNAIVRGHDDRPNSMSEELRQLTAQFVDLPLYANLDGMTADLDHDVVFRVREAVRSALQNVRLHSRASEVVLFADSGRTDWVVSVRDDGIGFPEGQDFNLGGEIIRGAADVGVTVSVQSRPGSGTFVEFAGST